jgi:hypothetical protein
MPISAPEWLAKHGGTLRQDKPARRWLVILHDEPQYRLDPHPAVGKFGCEIVQTNNGRHLGSSSVCPSEEEAVQSGLEVLRKFLGW